MQVMFILMGFSLLAAVGFLIAYLWAVRQGQFDDPVTPAIRILFEDEPRVRHMVDTKEEGGN